MHRLTDGSTTGASALRLSSGYAMATLDQQSPMPAESFMIHPPRPAMNDESSRKKPSKLYHLAGRDNTMLKLNDVLPEFADELAQGLADMGHTQLAATVHSLTIAERCMCDEPGCVTFHAVPRNSAPDGKMLERIVAPAKGVVCVQYTGQQIIWIEVLGRPKDREKLDRLDPNRLQRGGRF